ncbi:MAG: glycosyltransferase family 2 protein [Planctomycetota bacterium]
MAPTSGTETNYTGFAARSEAYAMRVLTALPVFNEEKHVARVLEEVRRHTKHILVVDDGSTDGTSRILADTPRIRTITHRENRGYGRSLIDALQYADRQGYDWVITLDCDDQHEPARIPDFIDRAGRGDVDIVSGSRYLVDLPENTPAPEDRRLINARITHMINHMLDLSLTDAFCGFKACRVEAMAGLPLSVPGYAFPLQFWVQAVAGGLRICELPVPLIYNDPNRHFGGPLDDPQIRMQHYLDVFRTELASVFTAWTCPMGGHTDGTSAALPCGCLSAG